MQSSRDEGPNPELERRLAQVTLVALDVDGVLTDGRVIYRGREEAQEFDVQDGQGIAWLLRAGLRVVWITGRGCAATEWRAEELGITELHMRIADKRTVLEDVQARHGAGLLETLAMGDDFADLALAAASGVFACPANARREVRAAADIVTDASGGRGAVRELAETLLAARGSWQAIVDSLEG